MWLSPYHRSVRKRAIDVLLAVVIGLSCLPLMLLVGLAVGVCDGRPILLWQERAGKGESVFRMPKFCTLRRRHGGSLQPTRLGSWLRKHRLDELPQVWSILRGDMSMVGPRPELIEIVADYQSRHRSRLAVKPGLTGPWQVCATRRVPIHARMQYDLYYIRKACFRLDARLVFRTAVFV